MVFLGSKIEDANTTSFRVWAPLAIQVDVVGEFNNWTENTSPLQSDGNGYWAGTINNIRKNDIYKFIIHRHDGTTAYRIDPATRDTVDSDTINALNHGIVTDTKFNTSPFTTPHFDDLIIYQCHIGSFCGRNDGMNRSNWTATFQDNISKLDYIKSLGFNAVEILPVQEYRGDRSWGYNPSFYFSLASAVGKPDDLRTYVEECHKRGLAVIFDVVYNHISNIDSSFWHFDDASVNSYLSAFETPWGLSPAFWKDGIKNFFLSNMAMYFNEYNGDGIRFDATRYIEYNKGLGNDGWEFMQYLTWSAKLLFPGKYLIAEHVPPHDSIIGSAGFHATWYRPAYDHILEALKGNDPVANIKYCMGLDFGTGNIYTYSWNVVKYFLGSHDECGDMNNGNNDHRYYIEKFGGRENWDARSKARMAWVMNITCLGTPMLFMGNECYMWGYWDDSCDNNGDHRFDWSVAGDNYGMEMRRLVTSSNKIRWDHPALRRGFMESTHEDYDNNIIAFKRWTNDGDNVLVVINAGSTTFTENSYSLTTRQPGRWQQILCSQDAAFGGWDGSGNAFYDPVTTGNNQINISIPKWSVLIFKLL